MKRSILVAAAAAVASTGIVGETVAQAEITVATVGPMTGQYAIFGEQMRRGATYMVEQINKAGGINGEEVRLEIGDDVCDPRQAVAVANQMAAAGVAAVIGHYCSGSSIPASMVYHEEGILQITPASTNPALTEDAAAKGWDNVF
jgi:branched-chain amino acid transport system substrate-binding protein